LITLSTFFGSNFPPNWYAVIISNTDSGTQIMSTVKLIHCTILNTDCQTQLVNSDWELLKEFFPWGGRKEFATRGSRTDSDPAFSGSEFYVWTEEWFQARP
jgi:hypothetical protein